jgi:chemotaxis regulatin CheY-phosphate phosphatase CheZ
MMPTRAATTVNDLAAHNNGLSAAGEQARCEECDRPIERVRGHRARRYCSDTCKQKAYQSRQAQKEVEARRVRLRAICPDLEELAIELLDELAGVNNHELAQRVVAAIARQMEYRQQGLEQVQERFRAYVETTNERVGNLCGELAQCRRELERKPHMRMTRPEFRELEQAREDLLRLYQERAREQEEIHRLYELAQDYQRDLGAARNRIAELEQQAARPVHIGDLLFELGAQLNYPELWFSSPEWKESARILVGREYWRRFCERGAVLEVRAAYEVAKQRVESNRH